MSFLPCLLVENVGYNCEKWKINAHHMHITESHDVCIVSRKFRRLARNGQTTH